MDITLAAISLSALTFRDTKLSIIRFPWAEGAEKIAIKENRAVAIFGDKTILIGWEGTYEPYITLSEGSSGIANPFTIEDIVTMLSNRAFKEEEPNAEADIMTQELNGPKIYASRQLRYDLYVDKAGIYLNDKTDEQVGEPLIRFYSE